MRSGLTRLLSAAAIAPLIAALSVPAADASTAGPVIPGWVRPGFTVRYIEDLGSGRVNYDTTDSVTSVSHGVASVTTSTYAPYDPGTAATYHWSCSASGHCPGGAAGFQFWVDPEHPVLSLSGHAGADFKYEGQEKWTDAFGGKWTVGVLQSGVPNGAPSGTIFYEASTGLVMYHYDSSYVGRVRVTEITWYHIAPFPAGSDWG